mgnify:CR=1 FL=1
MDRVDKLLELVRLNVDSDIDTVMIWNYENSSSANTFYLSGFKGSCSVLILRDDGRYIVTDSRYFEQAQEESTFQLVKHTGEKLTDSVASLLKDLSAEVIGFEAEKLDCKTYNELTEKLDVKFLPVDRMLWLMRSVKSEDEIEAIREASRVAEQSFLDTLGVLKEDVSELDICAELEYRIKKRGGQVGFETLIGTGPRTSLPHAKPTSRQAKRGELILFDFGAKVRGYCCDITRMVSVGEVEEEIKECYALVKKSLLQAIAEGKAGVVARQVDSVARQVILESKYAEFCFSYGLGHGIGLEVHEIPRMGPKFEEPLPANSVVTVEPGIYMPGKFGIRIENDVVVRDGGFETITNLDDDLIQI